MDGIGNALAKNEPDSEKTTRIECTTTAADEPFTLEIYHKWSPLGAERFVGMVEDGFFTDVAMFRCVKNFLVQFGISPDPNSAKKAYWQQQGSIKDDPSLAIPFERGMLSFAGGGVDSRTTQVFITFVDLPHLGSPKAPWETPLGRVTSGMDTVVDKLYTGYGDQQGFNPNGVNQGTLQNRGNAYLRDNFPMLDYLKECRVIAEAVEEEPHDDVNAEAIIDAVSALAADGGVLGGEVAKMVGGRNGAVDDLYARADTLLTLFLFPFVVLGMACLVRNKSKKESRMTN